MTPPNDMPADTELREFIESWIPINVKDAHHVKVAKIEARDEFMQLIHARDERREREIEAKFRMDNIYAIGGITDYQIILYKNRSEVMRTPIYDIHTLLIAQGTTNQLPNDMKEEG